MAPAAELPRPPRIPKLTYRNCLPADDLSLISRSSSTDALPNDTPADQRFFTPDYDCISTTSSQPASLASSDGSISRESKASSTKKKKTGVLSFLTLKEPSQLALDQFADAQRKKTTAKGGKPSPVGLQNISPQKLPPSVPKVNSKWDGVPESLKSSRNSITSSMRTSTSSGGSTNHATRCSTINASAVSVATNDSRGPPNSLASPMHSAINLTEKTPTNSPSRSDSPSAISLPEMTSFFPDDPSSSGALPNSSAEHPRSSPSHLDQDLSQTIVTNFDEKLTMGDPDMVISDEVDAIFRRLNGGPAESPGVCFGAEDDDADVPDTHDFLFDVKPILAVSPPRNSSCQVSIPSSPPITVPSYVPTGRPPANFSRPRPNQTYSNPPRPNPYAHHQKFSAPPLPTLYEASVASTDDTDTASDTTEIGRTNTRGSTDSTGSFSAPSIAPSTAPSVATSFTPSVMSASWYRSSRERLGLGGRIRKNDILPWEQTEQGHRGKPRKSRLSVFSRG